VIEAGFTGEYWREVAGFSPELSKRDCGRVLDILDMFRIITFSIRRLEKDGATVDEELSYKLEFQGFDGNDGLESHMASYVKFLMSDGRWAELHPQVDSNDGGNSHSLMLDTYMRMVAEHRRIKAGRDRGFHREDYLLSLEELEQIAAARAHPSRRGRRCLADASVLDAVRHAADVGAEPAAAFEVVDDAGYRDVEAGDVEAVVATAQGKVGAPTVGTEVVHSMDQRPGPEDVGVLDGEALVGERRPLESRSSLRHRVPFTSGIP
jgi:uncharacterized protein YfbU (UPF0304 family)